MHDPIPLPDEIPGMLVVMAVPDARVDLSQFRIIQDDYWERALHELRQHIARLLADVARDASAGSLGWPGLRSVGRTQLQILGKRLLDS